MCQWCGPGWWRFDGSVDGERDEEMVRGAGRVGVGARWLTVDWPGSTFAVITEGARREEGVVAAWLAWWAAGVFLFVESPIECAEVPLDLFRSRRVQRAI